jgi:hypothetical protein
VTSLTAAMAGAASPCGSSGFGGPNKLADMNSFFYKTLLRGGFNQLNHNLYETLPYELKFNAYTTTKSYDFKLLKFLNKLTNYLNDAAEAWDNSDDTRDGIVRFLRVYDKNYDTTATAINYARAKIGGVSITELVLRIFAVLIWHNSSITSDSLFKNEEFVRNETVAHAYKAAESTRIFIIEQQQIFKLKHSNDSNNTPVKSLIDILNEKVLYLLKFERLDEKTLSYEINKNQNNTMMRDSADLISTSLLNQNQTHSQPNHSNHHSANLLFGKKKKSNRGYPKYELVPTFNVVFDFIFDKNINNLEQINKILNLKRSLALVTTKNFNLAAKFLNSFLRSKRSTTKFNLEYVLTYLSSFFSSSPSLQFSSSYNLKSNSVSASTSASSSSSATSAASTAGASNLPQATVMVLLIRRAKIPNRDCSRFRLRFNLVLFIIYRICMLVV